jgi:cytochrome c oxidase subunit 2
MFDNVPLYPPSASTLSGRVDALYWAALAVSVFFSLLIAGLILYFMFKYRRRHAGDVGLAKYASMKLELTWMFIPLVISLVLFAWGAWVFFAWARPPATATEYYVVGKQWMWKFQHPEGNREINELHVPVGQRIKLIMTSEDVIHSLYFPAFRVKMDVLPARYTTLWFEATRTGTYHLFCTEYCGTWHSRMVGRVVVLEPNEYEAWLEGGGGGRSMVQAGEELFSSLGCATCHRQDTTARGPQLAGVFGRQVLLQDGRGVLADETYLRESILNPAARIVRGFQPIMPTFQVQVSEEELMQLISYIKTLQGVPAGVAAPPPPAAIQGGIP